MISVVMATYNGEKYIIKQLDSILNQSKQPTEVIIYDDCSKDNTINIVREYIRKNNLENWKLYKSKQNQGHYRTFLKGLEVASGDIIFFSDQDDIWKVDKIKIMYDIMTQHKDISLLECRSEFIDENDKIIKRKRVSGKLKEIKYEKLCKSWGSGYTMAITKEVAELGLRNNIFELPGFDYHDVLIAYFSRFLGKSYVINKVLDQHRLHQNNVTKKLIVSH